MLPPEFKTVKQPLGSKVCGAATVAMAIGVTLEEAEEMMEPTHLSDGSHYYKTREVLRVLGAHGIQCGLGIQINPKYSDKITPDTELEFLIKLSEDYKALVVVKSETFSGKYHYVFWDGEQIRDPSPCVNVSSLTDYDIVEIVPLIYIDETECKEG